MTRNQILSIVAATLLGAFWVYPNVERTQARGPSSVNVRAVDPSMRPIHRTRTHVKPLRVKTYAHKKAKRSLASVRPAKAIKAGHSIERRPTSLPQKKLRKRSTVAGR